MEKTKLFNLKEVIFEMKWPQKDIPTEIRKENEILAGMLHKSLLQEYPFHEPLPIATVPFPEEITGGLVRHRFRKKENGWPLVQIGAGIFTVNDTKSYKWTDFNTRIKNGIHSLFENYQVNEYITELRLRYINTIEFDFEKQNIFQFLKEKVNLEISLPNDIFTKTKTVSTPTSFSWYFSFPSEDKKTIIELVVAKGKDEDKDALIWDTRVFTNVNSVPKLPDKIDDWLTPAHNTANEWFKQSIKEE